MRSRLGRRPAQRHEAHRHRSIDLGVGAEPAHSGDHRQSAQLGFWLDVGRHHPTAHPTTVERRPVPPNPPGGSGPAERVRDSRVHGPSPEHRAPPARHLLRRAQVHRVRADRSRAQARAGERMRAAAPDRSRRRTKSQVQDRAYRHPNPTELTAVSRGLRTPQRSVRVDQRLSELLRASTRSVRSQVKPPPSGLRPKWPYAAVCWYMGWSSSRSRTMAPGRRSNTSRTAGVELGRIDRARCRRSPPAPTPGAPCRSRRRPGPRNATAAPAATTFLATHRVA